MKIRRNELFIRTKILTNTSKISLKFKSIEFKGHLGFDSEVYKSLYISSEFVYVVIEYSNM